MNRRGFLSNLIKGVTAFTILPPSTTYERIWKVTIDPRSIVNPEWVNAEYEVKFLVFDKPFRIMDLPIGPSPFNFPDELFKRYKIIDKNAIEISKC